jgi:threonine/homoserine/homoserine lactone efflux protein
MNDLVGLVAFAFVGSASPGPNNTILWASGMQFGFRRTVPHVAGTALGIGTLVLGVAAGIGAFLDAVPSAEVALKILGSAYLLYVSYRVLGGGVLGQADVARPLSLRQAIVFQCLNPKAWIFALAAIGAFSPAEGSRPAGAALLTGILMVVVTASSALWAIGGVAIGRVVESDRVRRGIQITLGALVVASVALIWI